MPAVLCLPFFSFLTLSQSRATPAARNFGAGLCASSMLAVERRDAQTLDLLNHWISTRQVFNRSSDKRNSHNSHEICVMIIGEGSLSYLRSSTSTSPSRAVLSTERSSIPDRRLGMKFQDDGWICKFSNFEALSTTISSHDLANVDCLCFNIAETMSLGMMARIDSAAPHIVCVQVLKEAKEKQQRNKLPKIDMGLKIFDYECTEDELQSLMPAIAKSCIMAKAEMLFP